MVKAVYEEPARGYALSLYCACHIETATGRIVGVSILAAKEGDTPADEMLERLCADLGQLITYHLRMGVLPEALSLKLHEATAGGGEVGTGPGQVKFPIHRPGVCLIGLTSPLSAIVTACVVASTDWRNNTAQLAQEGVVGHA